MLAVEAALFAALLLLFHARLSGTHIDPRMLRQVRDWPSALIPPILFLNSAILVTSMLTMARARRHIFAEFDLIDEWLGMGRPALENALKWLGGTLILGLLFLAGQWVGWNQFNDAGLGIEQQSTPAGRAFHLLAGAHAVHLAAGILALTVCLGVLCTIKRIQHRQIAVDVVAWFWHAMGFAWLLLFAALTCWQ